MKLNYYVFYLISGIFIYSNVYADNSASQCLIKHELCFNSCCPTGTPEDNYFVDHDIFVLSSNKTTKFADWVSYKIEASNLDGPSRKRSWRQDPLINSGDTLSPEDYKNAAASCGYDRGHQAPLGSFTNNPSWYKANYLSNITPQASDLNQGAWNNLEISERNISNKYNQIYVATGPYYTKDHMCLLPNSNAGEIVPNGYWKVISVIVSDTSTKYIAFLFSQNTKKNDSYCNHIATLDQISSLTHINVLPINSGEASKDLAKDIGCS